MAEDVVYLGPVKVPVVPPGQALRPLDPQIWMTVFEDTALYHPRLVAKVEEREAVRRIEDPTEAGCLGGQKLRDMNDWGFPEVDLLNARVKALFRRQAKCREAYIDNSWINIYRRHDYIAPHCHRRSLLSAVYCLAAGEETPADPMSGDFCIVDPRLDICCQEQKHYMTTPLHIKLRAGALVMFPSYLLHMVTPYLGDRPRITVAWNLNPTPLAGSALEAPPIYSRERPA